MFHALLNKLCSLYVCVCARARVCGVYACVWCVRARTCVCVCVRLPPQLLTCVRMFPRVCVCHMLHFKGA